MNLKKIRGDLKKSRKHLKVKISKSNKLSERLGGRRGRFLITRRLIRVGQKERINLLQLAMVGALKPINRRTRGLRIQLSGRIRGVNMARALVFRINRYSAGSLNQKIQYNYKPIQTKWGIWGFKVHMT